MVIFSTELPLSPTVNSYQRNSKVNRRYTTKQGVEFIKQVIQEMDRIGMKDKNIDYEVSLHVRIYFRDKRISDLDNRVKPLQDALEKAGVYKNDSQIGWLDVRRGGIVKGGKLEVTLRKLEETWN